jgi:hypothetical protein
MAPLGIRVWLLKSKDGDVLAQRTCTAFVLLLTRTQPATASEPVVRTHGDPHTSGSEAAYLAIAMNSGARNESEHDRIDHGYRRAQRVRTRSRQPSISRLTEAIHFEFHTDAARATLGAPWPAPQSGN